MTVIEFFLRATGKFEITKRLSRSLCRFVVRKPVLRHQLNKFYNRLSPNERVYFHYCFASIFRNRCIPINGVWNIKFNNKTISLPLQSNTIWLDWDLAVSIVGHDVEIKSFYKKFINSHQRPIIFFDVGANYGTHSLLFLSQNMHAITFEPNPECKPFFLKCLELNSLEGKIENVAVGEEKSEAELVFPKNDTWNGSLNPHYQQQLSNYTDLNYVKVEIISLDDYVAEHNIKPDLIKIDTEGFELSVLKGAKNILTDLHPVVIFESNRPEERLAVFKYFDNIGYYVCDIETFFSNKVILNEKSFIDSAQVNFVGFKDREIAVTN